MKTNTRIINVLGGPGVGKSTIAAGLFTRLKASGVNCELITEYARDISYEANQQLLQMQLFVFAEQFRRQYRLLDKVDYVITDSPLILNSIYFDYHIEKLGLDHTKFTPEYIQTTKDYFDQTFLQFNNINFLINRNVPYSYINRNQTKTEALKLDKKIKDRTLWYDPHCHVVDMPPNTVTHYIESVILSQQE